MIGSSGLARALPEGTRPVQNFSVDTTIPTLFVLGSMHTTSRMQNEELASHGIQGIKLLRSHIGNNRKLNDLRDRVGNLLGKGETVYIATPDDFAHDTDLQKDIEESIGDVSAIDTVRHNLVVVGGETARSTLNKRNIHSLYVRTEFKEGIPVSTEGEKDDAILTKAGGFGHRFTLIDINNYLQ